MAHHSTRNWTWLLYYWNCCKSVGQETYKTWRWELLSSFSSLSYNVKEYPAKSNIMNEIGSLEEILKELTLRYR